MADRLVVRDNYRDEYWLEWATEFGTGLAIGSGPLTSDEARSMGDFLTAAALELAAADHATGKASRTAIGIYYWDTASAAHAILRAARVLAKAAQTQVLMPAWATTALAEGWKPPKGWKPTPRR